MEERGDRAGLDIFRDVCCVAEDCFALPPFADFRHPRARCFRFFFAGSGAGSGAAWEAAGGE